MPSRIALFLGLILLPTFALAEPLSREEFQRQKAVLDQLGKSVAAQASDADKFAVIKGVMAAESDADLRRRVLDVATASPGAEMETFLIAVLKTDADAGLRSHAATTLGKRGSQECLAALATAAASDRTTSVQQGDLRGQSSARRSATFALADLAERFPKLADKAAAELRALPDVVDTKDNESLADARWQSLYQITRDESLLKPFFERLRSDDPAVREQGVIAFRFLKLKKAPPEVVRALQDTSADVRSWAALVLGDIGDPKTAAPLMSIAGDSKLDRLSRTNAIYALGQMRAPAAAEQMEKLLADPDVATGAAIALYRITGKKTGQFPEGYNAD